MNRMSHENTVSGSHTESKAVGVAKKSHRRDGLFKKNGWWWIDYYDSQGKRHRKKAAPDYQTAQLIYRNTMTAIAKGEVIGVKEEGLRFKEFTEKRYRPTVRGNLSTWEQIRAPSIIERQLLPRFGDIKLSKAATGGHRAVAG